MIEDVYIRTHEDPKVVDDLVLGRSRMGYELLSITPNVLNGRLVFTVVMVSKSTYERNLAK